jgi:hypothetical protein
MYREIISTPLVKVLYGGKMPSVWIEDDDVPDVRADDKGWEEASDDRRDATAWRRNWGSY